MKTLTTMSLCFAVALLGTVSVASAQVVHDSFWADMDNQNNVITGSSETFYGYPQPDGPTWWNAWFFNNEEIAGWKWIEYFFEIRNTNGSTNDIEVAINWSGPDWLDPNTPPIDPADDPFIVRETIWLGPLAEGLNVLDNRAGTGLEQIIIPNYNPIWVSFDIRAFPGGNPGAEGLQIDGQIWHEHIIPEPATMALLAFGGLGVLIRRRRR